ncbi:MAG: Rv0361 family membrane protein [Jatrophihabitans sp.]
MSDQGYGGPGNPGQGPGGQGGGEWNQPPQYGQQPNYGDPYGQAGYQPQQPQYPTAPYGSDQFGGPPQYGQHPYGQEQYGPYSGGAPPNHGNSQKSLFVGLGVVVVAGLVVLVLALTGVFSSASTKTSAGPKDAVNNVLLASKNQNLGDLKSNVCSKDLASSSELAAVVGDNHATSYVIGPVKDQTDSSAKVETTVTAKGRTSTSDLPVVKENGKWKVCFSNELNPTVGPLPTDTYPSPTDSSPTDTYPGPSSASSYSPSSNLCNTTSDANGTARLFVSAVTLADASLAQGCVYKGTVSASHVQALFGATKKYNPYDLAGQQGPTYTVKSVSGSGPSLVFTVTRESDGHYYVTSAHE